MATLTSTLTFSGTINGRAISYSNTFTITGILDAADNSGLSDELGGILSSSSAVTPWMDYSSPQFMTFYNASDSDPLLLQLSGNPGPVSIQLTIPPGGFFIGNKAGDGGFFNISATATTTSFVDLDQVNVEVVNDGGPKGPYRIFAAYKNPAS